MISIKNNDIKVTINPIGAELEYFYINDINILWERKENIWNSQSPILFPIVCGLNDSYYIYNDNKYELPPHGFVRNKEFLIEDFTDNSVVLSYIYNDDTLSIYPFKFKLLVKYEIASNEFSTEFTVVNLDDKEIYFSLGFHPGFSYKGLWSLLGSNLILKSDNNQVKEIEFSPSYVTREVDRTLNDYTLSTMTSELIGKRTLCFKKMGNFYITDNKTLEFENEMDYFAFWQKGPESNPEFICVEGWDGLPDTVDTDHLLENKLGIIKLGINKIYNKKFKIKLKG